MSEVVEGKGWFYSWQLRARRWTQAPPLSSSVQVADGNMMALNDLNMSLQSQRNNFIAISILSLITKSAK